LEYGKQDPYEVLYAWLEEQAAEALSRLGRKSGSKYASMFEFVLAEGARFEPAPLPSWLEPREVKQCFANAYDLATFCDWMSGVPNHQFAYVEGFAMCDSTGAMHHSWNVRTTTADKDILEVVDTTWNGDPFPAAEERAYMGIAFDSEWLERNIPRNTKGLIDDWQHGWPLLRDGVPPDAHYRPEP
jgi:hypothetical protein